MAADPSPDDEEAGLDEENHEESLDDLRRDAPEHRPQMGER